ncbi:UDP-Glycosyltransferase superfamily protein [Euphorbia peplus]|nr:UDP-Glycosyltransferase superfamily protein [Euphorbia peplus]
MPSEVLVLPAFGQGHLFPCMELCKLITSLHYNTTLIIFPHLSSSVPSTFRNHPLIQVVDVPSGSTSGSSPMDPDTRNNFLICLQNLLSTRPNKPLCAIVDVLIIANWSTDVFNKFQIPTISFFSSGACSAALECASWKASPIDINPGETLFLPGLPEQIGLTVYDLKRRSHGGPPRTTTSGPPKGFGLPSPGDFPPWVKDTKGSIGLMINTCDDLERPFLDYLSNETKKPVWGVGPLFPEEYWKSSSLQLIHDSNIRTNKSANVTEESVIQWLDSKPRGSVIYVSFGSSVDLSKEEYPPLAEALEASTHPFIWVIRANAGRSGPPRGKSEHPDPNEEGYFPHGMNERVGERGLIIRGWAPQLLILSHKSTGGFLSHMGWNSTIEGIGRGVPFLAWPLRGDQYYDAKLVVSLLKVGYNVSDDLSEMVTKDDIVKGIDKLMRDKEMKKRAEEIGSKFSNAASMDALVHFFEFVKSELSLSQLVSSPAI